MLKKKSLIMLSTALVVSAIIAGGTYAFFTSTATASTTDNSITAGKVEIGLNASTSNTPQTQVVMPGDDTPVSLGGFDLVNKSSTHNQGIIVGINLDAKDIGKNIIVNKFPIASLNGGEYVATGSTKEDFPLVKTDGNVNDECKYFVIESTKAPTTGAYTASNGITYFYLKDTDSTVENFFSADATLKGEAGNDYQGCTVRFSDDTIKADASQALQAAVTQKWSTLSTTEITTIMALVK